MTSGTSTLDNELQVLFDAVCKGLIEEGKARQHQVKLGDDLTWVSMTAEREAGIASFLATQLRKTAFFTQVESYALGESETIRPDLRIWLRVNKRPLTLELKIYGYGQGWSYNYKIKTELVKNDLGKLGKLLPKTLPNGLLVVGFSKPDETGVRWHLSEAYERLAKEIADSHSQYQPVASTPKRVNLASMDKRTDYDMVGLWVRKPDSSPSPQSAEQHTRSS